MEAAKATPPSSCPVNHGAWLGSGSGSGSGTGAGTGTAASDGASAGASACPVRDGSGSAAVGVDPGNMMKAGGERNLPAPMQKMPLDTTRQTSTIPKSEYNPDHQDGTKNLWEYPSPQMFFNAMRRKGYQPSEQDMNMVVAIHNAVNERAWSEVLAWENLHTSSCGQPKLLKFEGRPKDLTPRARVKSWLGYALPFDRHDWTVDRCGQQVRYVIDFYNAPGDGQTAAIGMHLDVRPALDGAGAVADRVRMQMHRWLGWG